MCPPPQKKIKNPFPLKEKKINHFRQFLPLFVFLQKKNHTRGGQIYIRIFSSSFTLISAHLNFHYPRTTPSVRKVIRRRRKKEKKTINSVATSFAAQPVCNTTQAAHALRSDQLLLGTLNGKGCGGRCVYVGVVLPSWLK